MRRQERFLRLLSVIPCSTKVGTPTIHPHSTPAARVSFYPYAVGLIERLRAEARVSLPLSGAVKEVIKGIKIEMGQDMPKVADP
jgi:hypothetical protein